MYTDNSWSYFQWLLGQALAIAIVSPIGLLCLLLTVCLIVCLGWQNPFKSDRWKRSYWLVLTQFLFLPAAAAVGVLYRASTDVATIKPNPTGERGLEILLGLSLALACLWVYRMKGLRWFAFCLLALSELMLFAVIFVASMSITGDWL